MKKSIDRAIDLRYEKLLEDAKLQAQESSRRKAALHDQQSRVLQELVSHVHRLRRLAKDMWKLVSAGEAHTKKWQEFVRSNNEFEQRFREFQEFISNNRVLLTHQYLAIQHDINSLVATIRMNRQFREHKLDDIDDIEDLTTNLQNSLERLEEGYATMLYMAQIQLGILDDNQKTK